jgi:hypothetical protein
MKIWSYLPKATRNFYNRMQHHPFKQGFAIGNSKTVE